MLVYHVIADGEVGGAGVFLSHLLPALSSLGVRSKVVLPFDSDLSPLLEKEGISLLYVGRRDKPFSLSDVGALLRLLRREKPSLAVSHGSLSVKIAARLALLPLITVKHCDLPLSHPRLYRALTDATVATSFPCALHLKKQGVSPVFCSENGSCPVAPPSEERRRAARRALSLSDNAFAIGLCGRLSAVKGHETALRALSLLSKTDTEARLLFLGEGEEEARLRELARTLGVEKRVVFLGYTSHTAPFYAALDAHLSCSLASETSSLSLAEGMAAAIPTIASATEGNLSRVGKGGMLYPPDNAKALAACLLRLSAASERNAWKAAALRRATELPTWEETAKKYRALFEMLASRQKKNGGNGCNFDKNMLQ